MTIIDDDDDYLSEEDVCPLCVEEMDISDKRFKPCPCGYQICQFCYNNIRQNPELNGRCPACRRKYDDDSVEYISLTPDEIKAENARRVKRDKERKQREKERKEQENASRKHLAGIRVIQKNLVYVVGLNPPGVSQDEVQPVLRSDRYFGQYGKISKLVVNKRNQNANSIGNSGYGIYVTFVKKEDADKCIKAIDGSVMDGKVIRAAYGTTKYCSSYLRGANCPNPNCMFLHEPGEEADSYTRQDMSTHQGNELGRHREGGIIRYGVHPNNAHGPAAAGGAGVSTGGVSSGNGASAASGSSAGSVVGATSGAGGIGGTNNNSSSNISGITNHSFSDVHEHTDAKPGLPATASWAKTSATHSNSPKPKNATLANASAFPTLAETYLERTTSGTSISHVPQKEKKKDRSKDKESKSKDNLDDFFNNEHIAMECMDEMMKYLKSSFSAKTGGASGFNFNKEYFQDRYGDSVDDFPPLFAVLPDSCLTFAQNEVVPDSSLIAPIFARTNAENYFNSTIQVPADAVNSPPPGLKQPEQNSNNSHASEILGHLMSGKKVSA